MNKASILFIFLSLLLTFSSAKNKETRFFGEEFLVELKFTQTIEEIEKLFLDNLLMSKARLQANLHGSYEDYSCNSIYFWMPPSIPSFNYPLNASVFYDKVTHLPFLNHLILDKSKDSIKKKFFKKNAMNFLEIFEFASHLAFETQKALFFKKEKGMKMEERRKLHSKLYFAGLFFECLFLEIDEMQHTFYSTKQLDLKEARKLEKKKYKSIAESIKRIRDQDKEDSTYRRKKKHGYSKEASELYKEGEHNYHKMNNSYFSDEECRKDISLRPLWRKICKWKVHRFSKDGFYSKFLMETSNSNSLFSFETSSKCLEETLSELNYDFDDFHAIFSYYQIEVSCNLDSSPKILWSGIELFPQKLSQDSLVELRVSWDYFSDNFSPRLCDLNLYSHSNQNFYPYDEILIDNGNENIPAFPFESKCNSASFSSNYNRYGKSSLYTFSRKGQILEINERSSSKDLIIGEVKTSKCMKKKNEKKKSTTYRVLNSLRSSMIGGKFFEIFLSVFPSCTFDEIGQVSTPPIFIRSYHKHYKNCPNVNNCADIHLADWIKILRNKQIEMIPEARSRFFPQSIITDVNRIVETSKGFPLFDPKILQTKKCFSRSKKDVSKSFQSDISCYNYLDCFESLAQDEKFNKYFSKDLKEYFMNKTENGKYSNTMQKQQEVYQTSPFLEYLKENHEVSCGKNENFCISKEAPYNRACDYYDECSIKGDYFCQTSHVQENTVLVPFCQPRPSGNKGYNDPQNIPFQTNSTEILLCSLKKDQPQCENGYCSKGQFSPFLGSFDDYLKFCFESYSVHRKICSYDIQIDPTKI